MPEKPRHSPSVPQASLAEKASALDASLSAATREGAREMEALHVQLTGLRGDLRAAEDHSAKLQAALDDKAETLSAALAKLQV